MNKFSLLKYLDPYDSYDDTDSLTDKDKNYFEKNKRSKIYRRGMDEGIEILTQLHSILNYMEDDSYMSNFVFGKNGDAEERKQIMMMISGIRDRLMKLYNLGQTVKSKKHLNKK